MSSKINRYKDKKPINYDNNSDKGMRIAMLPLILISSFLPFIMYLHQYNPELQQYTWFMNINTYIDIFLYYKQFIFIIISALMLLIIISYFILTRSKLVFYPILLPITIYGLLAFLSTISSKYASYGLKGSFEQFESVFVLIGYCLIIYYCIYFIKTEKDIKIIIKYLLISILLLSLIGFFQSIGHDILRSDIGKKLYIPQEYWANLDSVVFSFPKKTAYLTFYNPNYAGVYTSFVIPILICLLLTEKNIKAKSILLLCIIGMSITLYASGSSAGIISLVFTIFIIIYFFRFYIFKNKKITLIVSTSISIIILIALVTQYNFISGVVSRTFNNTIKTQSLTNITTGDSLDLTYNQNKLSIFMNNSTETYNINLVDENNKEINTAQNSSTGELTILDPRFSDIIITPVMYDDILCLNINVNEKDWLFSNQIEDKTFYYLNTFGRFVKINNINNNFDSFESFASGRGYIWTRTFTLLKNSILLGTGADSFALVFPQQDYLNSYNHGFEGQIFTKPHSLYLQMGVQTGILSLLAFIVFYTIYFINSIRLYWKGNFTTYLEKVGVSLFIGTIAYMITATTNDSSITVAPVYWVVLGVGISINKMLKNHHLKNI